MASHFSDSLSPIKVVLLASTFDSRKQSIAVAPRGLIDNLRRRYQGYLLISRQFNHMTITVKSNWTGSESTLNLVKKQIAQRWGEDEANRYNPKENCLTFKNWLKNGYIVKKGEKALKSFVIVEKKDKETGKVIEKTPKSINLFYELQVEPKTA